MLREVDASDGKISILQLSTEHVPKHITHKCGFIWFDDDSEHTFQLLAHVTGNSYYFISRDVVSTEKCRIMTVNNNGLWLDRHNNTYWVSKRMEPNLVTTFYDKGCIVCKMYPNGDTVFFKGVRNEERIVSMKRLNGELYSFKGPRCEERLYRVYNERLKAYSFYLGEKGKEHLFFKTVDSDDYWFRGEKDKEYLVYFFSNKTKTSCYYEDGRVVRIETNAGIQGTSGRVHLRGPYFTYIGEIHEGKRQGYGKTLQLDQKTTYYEGEWFDDKKHGHGTTFFSNGTIDKKGLYVKNNFNRRKTEAIKRKANKSLGRARSKSAKLHSDSKFLEDVPQCVLCLGEMHHGDISHVYIPCGHRAMCASCRMSVNLKWETTCMICKQDASLYRLH